MSEPAAGPASGTQTGGTSGALVALLEHLIADAVVQMQARSGGGSVCSHARMGTTAAALKHSEGRWAALREVQRRADADGPAAALAHTRDAWGRDLARRRETSGEDWIAYRSGGLEALEELADSLGATDFGIRNE